MEIYWLKKYKLQRNAHIIWIYCDILVLEPDLQSDAKTGRWLEWDFTAAQLKMSWREQGTNRWLKMKAVHSGWRPEDGGNTSDMHWWSKLRRQTLKKHKAGEAKSALEKITQRLDNRQNKLTTSGRRTRFIMLQSTSWTARCQEEGKTYT